MDVTLPSYEAEMRDARAYLRRRDLSSYDDIPLYFAWQRLYAAASANLSTDFLQETREERDLRRRARLPPRRGISPPLFTSFDNTYRTSAQSSSFLRSGTSSDVAIEMMARRYRREAEKLRLSRETLVNALDRAEGRLKRHKQRQTRPEQEVEDVVVCPQSGNLRSGRALKSKLIDAWKRTEASDRRQNACDDESDEEYSQVVSRSKARKSTANRELGKESFKNDDVKASGDFRRSSMSNPTPLSSLSSAKSETVEAAWTTDWRMPPDIDDISRSSGLPRKGATLSSIKSGKGLGGTSDLRKFDLVEGCKERKMMSDTSIESSGLANDSFDPDALFDATPVSVCRPPTELDADAENTLGNTKVNQVRGATNSDVLAHDSLGIDSSLDNAQQTIGGNKSDAAENSLHLSNATGDMQVKIQGKKIEVTFKGELDDDRTNNDSDRDRESCAVTSSIASREGKQQLVLQKIFEANENDSRQSGRGDDEQGSIEQTIQDGNDAQSTELPRKSKRVRFVHDDPSRQKHEMDSEDHRSSDHQRSDNEFESAGLCDANTISSEVQKDFSPSDSTSENLSKQTSTSKFVLGNDRLDTTHDEDFPRERKPQKDQKKNDGRRQCSDADSSSASLTAANLDVAEDHNKQAEDGKALQEHIDFSKPQRHGNSKNEKLNGADPLDASKQIVAVAKPILKEGRSDKTKDRGNVQALGHFDTLEAHHMSDESKSECNDKEYPRVLEQTALATKSEFVQGGDCIEAKSTEARGDCQRSSKSGMDDKGINELNEGHTKASKQSTMRAKSASEVEQLEEKMSVNHLPGYNSSDQLQRSRVSRDKVGDLEHSNVSPRVATATISSLDCRSSSKKHQQKMRGDEDNEEKCNVLEQSGTVRKSGLERRHGSQDTILRDCCRSDKPDEVVIECDGEEVAGEGESQKSAKPVNNRGGEFRSASQTSEDKDFMNDHQHSNPQKRQDRSRYYKDDGHDTARLHDAKKSDTRLERSYQRSRFSGRPGHLASLVGQTDRDIEEGEESDENIPPDLRPSHEHENAQPSRRLFRERTNGARAVREHHLRSAKRGSSASQRRKNTNFDMQSLSDSSEERSNDAHEIKSRHEVNLVPKEEGRHRVISAHKSPGEVLLREQNNRDMLNSLACHDERGQHSRRHANQQEIATRSKFDSDEDFSYGSDTSDATRQHHRKFSHSSRTASTDRNYESQTHGRYVSSRSSSTHKRSSGSIDSDISRDDESLSDTDSSDQVWRLDRRQRPHKREQSQYRYLTENLAYQTRPEPSFPSRSIRERSSRDCDVLESKNHISTKSKLGAQRDCYDKFRSESRTKASTQKPHKVSEGIVWPPGMEAECIARLGRDGHHPIAPPGLEHLVTEEQWGDYWTWLHWYSSWQMWYMKNGKKPRCKSDKEKQSRHPRESLDMGADRRQHNVNWWLDVSSTKRPHSRNV